MAPTAPGRGRGLRQPPRPGPHAPEVDGAHHDHDDAGQENPPGFVKGHSPVRAGNLPAVAPVGGRTCWMLAGGQPPGQIVHPPPSTSAGDSPARIDAAQRAAREPASADRAVSESRLARGARTVEAKRGHSIGKGKGRDRRATIRGRLWRGLDGGRADGPERAGRMVECTREGLAVVAGAPA